MNRALQYTLSVLLLTGVGWGQQTKNCIDESGKPTLCYHPKLEPMDVPAASVTAKETTCRDTCTGTGVICSGMVICEKVVSWNCDFDKRRVLLTSENNNHHCILFPPQEVK